MKRTKPAPPPVPTEHCDGCKRMRPGVEMRNISTPEGWRVLCADCRMRR